MTEDTVCPECGRTFANRWALRKHLSSQGKAMHAKVGQWRTIPAAALDDQGAIYD